MNISYTQNMWEIKENNFNPDKLAKTEVIMAQGNGYLGIRAASEECYAKETRNFFVNGTFNQGFENEVTELPNLPDVLQVELKIEGKGFNLSQGRILNYNKKLNLKNGELVRELLWENKDTGKVKLTFKRFVSMDNLHLIVQSVSLEPLDRTIDLTVTSGIDGRMTNSGTQHFIEGEKRLINKKVLVMNGRTCESEIEVATGVVNKEYVSCDKSKIKNLGISDDIKTSDNQIIENSDKQIEHQVQMKRRVINSRSSVRVQQGETYHLTKYSYVVTNRDIEYLGQTASDLQSQVVKDLESISEIDYQSLLSKSAKVWQDRVWSQNEIKISCSDGWDQVALRFAQYHLQIMAPAHDNRLGIGAKGLTGEGYKGHSFWDTEIFILPYFLYLQPEIARNLLEYRYLTLNGARKKAQDNGFDGAMFPWESAWLEDGEVTPLLGAADIVTGKRAKIMTGILEQHISADIAYMVNRYFEMTGDQEFMDNYGYELLFETACFWASRLEEGQDGLLHINDVIGPDEYKEHVDDNTFTNYLVHFNIDLAIQHGKNLKLKNNDLWQQLNKKINIKGRIKDWQDKANRIYLPQPKGDGVLPQDSSYLNKKVIDLTKYRKQKNVGLIFKDYNFEQVNSFQVSKQADVIMLFYLREDLFSKDVKLANWNYYEEKTLHDSSLSLSTHSIIASDIEEGELAYTMFKKASEIDLGQNMDTCNEGIHSASLGGLSQTVINGFGGVRLINGQLRIEPHLPKEWERLSFVLHYKGDRLKIDINQNYLEITKETKVNDVLEIIANDNMYLVSDQTKIDLRKVKSKSVVMGK